MLSFVVFVWVWLRASGAAALAGWQKWAVLVAFCVGQLGDGNWGALWTLARVVFGVAGAKLGFWR